MRRTESVVLVGLAGDDGKTFCQTVYRSAEKQSELSDASKLAVEAVRLHYNTT